MLVIKTDHKTNYMASKIIVIYDECIQSVLEIINASISRDLSAVMQAI